MYLLPSGARIDNHVPGGGPARSRSGSTVTPEDLQDALDDLVYTPDPGYYYTTASAIRENLHLRHGPGQQRRHRPARSDGHGVDGHRHPRVRRQRLPDATTVRTTKSAEPEIELVINDEFTAADEDNDEDVDGAQATPPVAEDPLPDGDNTDMLLVGWLTCGQPIAPNTGFHFGSSIFQADDPSLDDSWSTFCNLRRPLDVRRRRPRRARGDQARPLDAEFATSAPDGLHDSVRRHLVDE